MEPHKVVSHDEWIAARKAYLVVEKAFSRARDALARKRRELPWERVQKNYSFDTPQGKKSLADLFGGKSQLTVYHFMLGPGWEAGCPSCSYLADHFDGAVVHLAQRDVSFVVVSRAPLSEIAAFQRGMGWRFKGCRRSAATSIRITRFHSRRRKRPAARFFTITSSSTASQAKNGRAPACFTRTPPAKSFTLIRPMAVASIS
jgi:predicted dithiol-disulfide oxidoreductase (DUF899 family)